ncbi:tetratricopeptide repeat protein [Thermogymnomonas acidicola]|uniref:tetratricopeptide repeat protein n=1 Tax=Thermogymnomonas acidicola TaxID=399579 RepID=UPI0009468834|nr:tetratricopeptide repeat protein [Thermogymnomonas acidicola]
MTLSRVDISRLVDGEMALRAAELMHRYGLNDRALKALAMAGRSPGETVLRARILSALGQGQEALQVLREVVQSQETDDETRRLYASLSLTAGKPEEAYRCLNTIISGGEGPQRKTS